MGDDLDRLQGTWNIVSLEMDGQRMPGAGARIGKPKPGTSMISTCQEKKHFSLHSPEGFEAPG